MVQNSILWEQESLISNRSQLNIDEDARFISFKPLSNMTQKSGLQKSRSFNALDDRLLYDVKVGYTKRKIPPITNTSTQKARVVTVYRNGDNYFGGTKVTIQPGKDFKGLENVFDFLSQRTKIPQGVRYIFTLDGRIVKDLDELLDGHSYVASGVKTFQEMNYGQLARLRTSQTFQHSNTGALRPDDMKLFRPWSPKALMKNEAGSSTKLSDIKSFTSFRGSGAISLPGSRESCVVTVVNNYDHSIKSRVLLNLKTKQSFEEVLEDMGQSIKLRKATRMLTPWGDEGYIKDQVHVIKSNSIAILKVLGFSHMRKDFFEVETFYLDYGDTDRKHVQKFAKTLDKPKRSRKPLLRSNSTSKITGLTKRNATTKADEEELPALRVRIQMNNDQHNNLFRG